ncbi:MAG: outer membrane beta-barrel protein [Flavipsychrobacter sp.]|nr:outer membrane beta-barrel protein [Flavipsychrobacter sp.]
MKKISAGLLAITIIIVTSNLAKAQDTKSADSPTKWVIGITGGISSPSGNFTKTDYDNGLSGFAGSGYNMGITSTWFIKKRFGITVLASYHHYSYQGIQNIANGFHEAFDVDSASATTRSSNHSINILVGPAYSLPVSTKFSFDFRVLAGIVDATLAGWDVVLTDANITHPALTQNASHATTFGMQAGAAIKYNITKQWAVLLNGDYFYSKPNFSIVNIDRNANAGREITNYNQSIAGINGNLTLAYYFKRK